MEENKEILNSETTSKDNEGKAEVSNFIRFIIDEDLKTGKRRIKLKRLNLLKKSTKHT